jgi:8-amino-7-oxononanoate synthase
MKLIEALDRQLQQLDQRQLRRRLRAVETPCAPQVRIDGRPLRAFCSNDYLGLAAHPAVVEALREGVARYGAGSGASHLISGHSVAHQILDERLAQFMAPHLDSPRALYFSSGYMANIALLTALAASDPNGDCAIFSESLNHASIIDGARLAKAAVQVYRHGDVEQLAGLLAASTAPTRIVVTDSVFSMDGDLAPLPQLLALCERHGAWLAVDDAHGFGVLGAHGRGALEHFGLRSPHLVYMGTLSKAAGVAGAFIAAHASVVEWILQRARPYIYTTAPPPALAHALLTSLELIGGAEGEARRSHLRALVAQFQAELELRRWRVLPSQTAIQPVILGDNGAALEAAAALHRQGLWVPAIRPPTVPPDTARLRVTLSAAHSAADVSRLAAALNALERAALPEAA